MNRILFDQRDLSDAEFQRMKAGFDEHTLSHHIDIQTADRFTFVATDGNRFVGTSSGLAYKNGNSFSGWFYLTDLFVEEAYRGRGIGARLLRMIESDIALVGVKHSWTWTAGYEAPGFYQKQGYEIFAELVHWYSDGSSRVALKKNLQEGIEEV